jgi:hypothetical protein
METVEAIGDVLDHTCSVVQAGTVAGGYGHIDNDWDTPAATTALIACHYSPGGVTEIEDARNQGTTVQHHTLWMKHADAPATLLVPGAEVTHRVTSIKRKVGGATVDAGPFDVEQVTDMAGVHQALRLVLKRIA